MPMTDREFNDAVARLVDEGHRVVLHGAAHLRLDRSKWRLESYRGAETSDMICHWECHSEDGHRICQKVCVPMADY